MSLTSSKGILARVEALNFFIGWSSLILVHWDGLRLQKKSLNRSWNALVRCDKKAWGGWVILHSEMDTMNLVSQKPQTINHHIPRSFSFISTAAFMPVLFPPILSTSHIDSSTPDILCTLGPESQYTSNLAWCIPHTVSCAWLNIITCKYNRGWRVAVVAQWA